MSGEVGMDSAMIESQRIAESIRVDEILLKLGGRKNLKRCLAFDALAGERVYQESLHKKTGQDPIPLQGELILLKVYLDKAFVAYADTFGDPGEKPTMDVIRKITAIGLRALENYGCPLRDIEGSLAARPPEHRAKDMTDRSADVLTDENLEEKVKEVIHQHELEGMVPPPDKTEEPVPPPVEDISEADVSKE